MKKADWVKAIDEAIEAKERIYNMGTPDMDRRKMDTVPMTSIRRMTEVEELRVRYEALQKRGLQRENEITGLRAHAEALNSECTEMMLAIQGAMPWMILLGDYIGNGTKDDPLGRCDAILAMRKALGRDAEETEEPENVVSVGADIR